MGEVYRARDTKLDRDVAIKVLPEKFATDPERIARFQREAKTLAALNHPHIAAIYGIVESGGTHALVMELVEGEDLSQRIARGLIPLDEALPIAKQIAEALEAAHEQGIIHRDLKPANIKVRPDGTVKVLDFGLAKLAEPGFGTRGSGVEGAVSMSPTITSPAMMTGIGIILGTAAYMSPEQARGRAADRRSDIWAFGCVLFEMLTGKRPFADDVTDTIAAVVKSEPDWNALRSSTPATVRRLLRQCLAKNPRQRLHDIADARIDLEMLAIETPADEVSGGRPAFVQRYWWVAALIILGATIGVVADRLFSTKTTSALTRQMPLLRTSIVLPPNAPLAFGIPGLGYNSPVVAVSPDGSWLAYVGRLSSGRILYIRDMKTGEVRPLLGTEDAVRPFFSPDGQWIGFLTSDHVKKVPRNGGTVISLCEADTPVHGWWHQPNQIYFTETETYALSRVAADGGKPERLVRAPDLKVLRFDDVLPDGESVLAESSPSISGDFGDIVRVNLRTRESRTVVRSGYAARYIEPGYLLFARASNLMATRFDRTSGESVGEPVTLASGVAMESLFGMLHADSSISGLAAYIPGRDLSVGKLAWIDRQGGVEYLDVPERVYGVLDLTSDEMRVAVHVADVKDYIWIWDLLRHEGRRVANQSSEGWPSWSHNGRQLAGTGPGRIYPIIHDVQSGGTVSEGRRLGDRTGFVAAWSPRDDVVALSAFPQLRVEFVGLHAPINVPTIEGTQPTFSPDGHWIAHFSSQAGTGEIFLRSYPEAKIAGQVSIGGGTEPRWMPNGDLYYRDGGRWFSTRVVTTGSEPQWERPQLVFDTEFIDTPGMSWAVSADGRRLLVVKRTESISPTTINLIVNWFDAYH